MSYRTIVSIAAALILGAVAVSNQALARGRGGVRAGGGFHAGAYRGGLAHRGGVYGGAYRGRYAYRGGYWRGGRWVPGVAAAAGAAAIGAAVASPYYNGYYDYYNGTCGHYGSPPCQ